MLPFRRFIGVLFDILGALKATIEAGRLSDQLISRDARGPHGAGDGR